MLNVALFDNAKEVWRNRDDCLERGYRFKLREVQLLGTNRAERKYKLTYWTKADAWTGKVVDANGKKQRLGSVECARTAIRFGIIV